MPQGGPVLVIAGPTAVGKTAAAVAVARRLNMEIVSADSMQVYRGMDIGTAKPTVAERQGVPHHLIDVVDPDQPFSVATYQSLARQAMAGIFARGRICLLTGGTGFYMRAALNDYTFTPAATPSELRAQLMRLAGERGAHWLHARLAAVDPAAAARIHPHNVRRVARALEVFELTGRPISAAEGGAGKELYDVLYIGLTMDRRRLYARIDARVHEQLQQGLLAEVAALSRRFSPRLPALQGLMYREAIAYRRGLLSRAEMIRLMQRGNRRYAKRQYAWFRREPRIAWLSIGEDKDSLSVVEDIVTAVAGKWPAGVERCSVPNPAHTHN